MFSTGNELLFYSIMGLYAAALALYLVRVRTIALVSLCAGVILHLLFLLGRCFITGIFLPNPMFEGPYLIPWAIAVIAAVSGLRNRQGRWGLLVLAALAFSTFALFYPRGIIPPTPKKVTVWANLFFLTEAFAHAMFYSGAFLAAASLAARDDDRTYHSCIVWGFVLYSVAQVTGAVWCYLGWGNTFRWGSRHMMSAAIWLTYAAYLHLRFMAGWNKTSRALFGVGAALLALAGSYASYIHEMFFPRIGG
jgi:ABC-type transport system involved in cytochrome c biogenesis permease subunit